MSYNISKLKKKNLLLGSAHIFIRRRPVKCDGVFLTPWPRLSTAHCPVITLLVGGWHRQLRPPTPPPSHLPDNSQRAPDKLVRVSRCSVHCTALNAGETTTEQRGTRKKKRKGSVGLSLRQLSTFSLSFSSYISDFCLCASFSAPSLRRIQKSIRG